MLTGSYIILEIILVTIAGLNSEHIVELIARADKEPVSFEMGFLVCEEYLIEGGSIHSSGFDLATVDRNHSI